MEQTIQQITQKSSFSIKTMIAAWWTILLGGLATIACVLIIKEWMNGSCWAGIQIPIFFFFPSFLGFLSGIFILIWNKKWAWWLTNVILFSMFLCSMIFFINALSVYIHGYPLDIFSIILPPLFFVPFILFILDRKNFFRIAS